MATQPLSRIFFISLGYICNKLSLPHHLFLYSWEEHNFSYFRFVTFINNTITCWLSLILSFYFVFYFNKTKQFLSVHKMWGAPLTHENVRFVANVAHISVLSIFVPEMSMKDASFCIVQINSVLLNIAKWNCKQFGSYGLKTVKNVHSSASFLTFNICRPSKSSFWKKKFAKNVENNMGNDFALNNDRKHIWTSQILWTLKSPAGQWK